MWYRCLEKMVSFQKRFEAKRFTCCALTIVYNIYNVIYTVGRSIASISDLGGILAIDLPNVLYILHITL